MSDLVRRLLDEYRARFAAGERPDVADYVARAGDDADALAELLDDFLRTVPAPEPPPETVAAIRAIAAAEPALLAQRTARGVRREAVIDALMTRFGFKKASRPKLEERYHELESGLLDPGRVDTGVLDAIAAALGLVRSQLVFSRPPQARLQAYLRMAPGARPKPEVSMAPPLFAAPMAVPAAAPEEPDEIDRLFGVGM
jgi:hypothetical protein